VTRSRSLVFTAALAAGLAAVAGLAAPARAGCPHVPTDDVCRPWTAMLLPTAWATVYAPKDLMGTWYGGGVEIALLTWSDSSRTLGPSHGRLRFDIGALGSSQAGAGTMTLYRGGAQVSFERNAAREYLIPYLAVDLGGLWTDATGTRGFVDGGAGLYLLHRRALVVDVEGTYLFSFRRDDVSGFRTQLALSVALW
jgi:hypothetical protein